MTDSKICWQYEMKLKNVDADLIDYEKIAGKKFSPNDISMNDFEIKILETRKEKETASKFIKKYEWLGKMPMYPKYTIALYHKPTNILSGVLVFSVPNAYSAVSKKLGIDHKDKEILISRGANISWASKNLPSHFIKIAMDWMTKNTPYRIFYGYSDPMANEIGTIYQALNFTYLGNTYGGGKTYISPYNGNKISSRTFTSRSMYKKYAIDLGIEWDDAWNTRSVMHWELMPSGIEEKIKSYGKELMSKCESIESQPKGKYMYIKGNDKRETKHLKKQLKPLFKALSEPLSYPKR